MSQSTSSVRSGHEIDTKSLESYLLKQIPGFSVPLHISQFNHGQSNPTYLLKDNNQQQYVLRKKPPGSLISKTAHAVEREYRIIRALGENTNVPVPKVYALCEDHSVIGTPFYVMEFLKGRIFDDIQMLDIPSEERRLCWFSAVETLAKLHAVDFKAIGLSDYGKDSGFYTRQMKSLLNVSETQAAVVDQDTKKAVGSIPRLNEMLAWFKRNQVKDQATLVHGDFKIDNLIFHPTEPKVIGILDWELSTIGHPLSDLSNLLQPFYIPREHGLVGLKGMKELPIPNAEELMQSYCSQLDTVPYPIQNWPFAVAFSFFRLSVIAQGIAARVARKQASSAKAKLHAEKFKPVAYLALEIMDQGDLDSKSKL
ncbi:kinase-like domain-containing protein [Gilbertella persicaria]|uniref:kinase-like domain-containing protein n=1 Tax=Gilbertella persicaria TaxID=101096 RepID=UPI00221F7320|nr:kinase-like domain-containing protein [Gilbertella persicaria]KAI8069039.1 kinase-like domain-containing protein [Gilbertella persicaria]